MNNNCCKNLALNLSKSLLESNGEKYNNLLLKQLKMCLELKNLGNKFNNCVKYESVLCKNKKT